MSIVLLLSLQTLRCGVVWDGAGHTWQDGRIAFEGDRIKAVGPADKVPAAPGEIDLRPLFCLPGLVDAHTHVTSYVEHKGDNEDIRRQWAVRNARETIESGVTTGRDMGDDYDDGIWIRDQINAGKVVGPRLQVAGEQIGPDPAHQKMTPAELRELV